MYLKARTARLDDLQAAFPIVQTRMRLPEALRGKMLAMWRAALKEADCIAPVIEDGDMSERTRLVAFALTFCVSEKMVHYIQNDAPPFPWQWMLEQWSEDRPIWLTKKDARKTQKELGANIFHLCYGSDDRRYSGIELKSIQESLSDAFIRGLSRRRMHYVVEEVYGESERNRHTMFGCDVSRDYREYANDAILGGRTRAEKPFLMVGDFRKAATDLRQTNTFVGRMALRGPQRFGFKDAEQEVMLLGLQGMTDESIADALCLSVIAIKKRWQGIYEKIDSFNHTFNGAGAPSDKQLQSQRRRQVLQMMDEHPEEFWARE